MERKNKPQEVRQNLLDAVQTLILSEGIGQVSIQKIADTAGVSKGGLFHHFKHKDELLAAYFDALLDEFDALLQAYPITDYRDFISAYARLTFDGVAHYGNQSMILLQFMSQKVYQQKWQDWLAKWESLDGVSFELTAWRYVIDGIWLNMAVGQIAPEALPELKQWFFKQMEQNNG